MSGRMLNKQEKPTFEEMAAFCGENGVRFILLNEWMTKTFQKEQQIVFRIFALIPSRDAGSFP